MNTEYRHKSLKYRILFLLIAGGLSLSLLISVISGSIYSSNMIDNHQTMALGVSRVLASSINAGSVQDWLNDKKTSEYDSLCSRITTILDSFAEELKISIIKPEPDGVTVVYSSDGESKGSKTDYPQRFAEVKENLVHGDNIAPLHTEIDELSFVSVITPIKLNGSVVSYVICETKTQHIYQKRNQLFLSLLMILAIFSVILVIFINLYISRKLIIPLNKIDGCLQKFTMDNSTGEEVHEKLSKISHNNLTEIDTIRNGFITLTNCVGIKEHEIEEIDRQIMERMKKLYGTDGETMYDV